MGNLVVTAKIGSNTTNKTTKVIEPLRFIIDFRPPDNYDGEFGFDFMEDGPNCTEPEKLKKEYKPTTIFGEEYIVPWLCMFHYQKNVKIKLTARDKQEGDQTDKDVVKFEPKGGVRLDPPEVKFSDVLSGVEVKVICDNPVTSDIAIEAKDRMGRVVGKINIFKNSIYEQLVVPVTFVKILIDRNPELDSSIVDNNMPGISIKEPSIDPFFTMDYDDGTLKGKLHGLEHYLNRRAFNQALISLEFERDSKGDFAMHEIVLEEAKLIADGLLTSDRFDFKDAKDDILDIFINKFEQLHSDHTKQRGVVVFITPVTHKDFGGQAITYDIDSKYCAVYADCLGNKSTFAHEIGHVLGLDHTFDNYETLAAKENIDFSYKTANEYVKEIDRINIELLKKYGKNSNELISFWKDHEDDFRFYNNVLNVYQMNKFLFAESSTKNFMDYSDTREIFFKYQWVALQKDVIDFYNKK